LLKNICRLRRFNEDISKGIKVATKRLKFTHTSNCRQSWHEISNASYANIGPALVD